MVIFGGLGKRYCELMCLWMESVNTAGAFPGSLAQVAGDVTNVVMIW